MLYVVSIILSITLYICAYLSVYAFLCFKQFQTHTKWSNNGLVFELIINVESALWASVGKEDQMVESQR